MASAVVLQLSPKSPKKVHDSPIHASQDLVGFGGKVGIFGNRQLVRMRLWRFRWQVVLRIESQDDAVATALSPFVPSVSVDTLIVETSIQLLNQRGDTVWICCAVEARARSWMRSRMRCRRRSLVIIGRVGGRR